MRLTLGFSPCPNDCFMFDAMVHQRIDLETLWHRAMKEASAKLDATCGPVAEVTAHLAACPLTIEDLAGEDFDIDRALLRLQGMS